MDVRNDYNLKPIGQQSVVWNIIDQLTEAMIQGKLKPGDKIPTENALSEAMQVSRNSVREAIKTLVAFGILEIRRADGTFIRSGITRQMLNPMIYGIMFSQTDSYRQLREFRQMVELSSLRLAIRHKTPEKLAALKTTYDDLIAELSAKAPRLECVMEKDIAFHMAISEISENLMMQEVSRLLYTLTCSKRAEVTRNLLYTNRTYLVDNHTDIYLTVVNGDEDSYRNILEDVIHPEYFGD